MGRKRTKKGVSKIDKSQTFSLDILIALGIFIAGIMVFLFLIGGNTDKNIGDKLVNEAEILPQKLIASDAYSATNTTIVIGNKVDGGLLNRSIAKEYSVLKRELDLVSDFCVHFEDENGEIVDLNDDACLVQYSMGDSRLTLTIQNETGGEEVIPCGTIKDIC